MKAASNAAGSKEKAAYFALDCERHSYFLFVALERIEGLIREFNGQDDHFLGIRFRMPGAALAGVREEHQQR
jgi:hypothetical protein